MIHVYENIIIQFFPGRIYQTMEEFDNHPERFIVVSPKESNEFRDQVWIFPGEISWNAWQKFAFGNEEDILKELLWILRKRQKESKKLEDFLLNL